jgi:tripartite-type tricarboxylate transporter receptor subunit TctC
MRQGFATRLRVIVSIFALAGFAAATGPATAQEGVASFYRGKTLQLVIGSSAGGGYDLYGRLVARYIGKYIPGNPTVIASNMAGAASIVATQHIAVAAPKDGMIIGAIYPGAIMEPLLGDKGKIKYDSRKLGFIGSANNELYVCIVRGDAGVKTFDDFLKGGILIGASAAGGSTRDFPALLMSTLGANFKIVSGYPGSTEILLAIEKGEVQGTCGIGWSTISVQRAQWVRDGLIKVVAQEGMKSDPELDRMKVPMALSFAKTPEQRQMMELCYGPLTFGRPFIVAPDTPPDRLEALRKAFMDAMSDPDLRAEAQRMKLEVDPLPGADVAITVARMFETPADIVQATRLAIGSK